MPLIVNRNGRLKLFLLPATLIKGIIEREYAGEALWPARDSYDSCIRHEAAVKRRRHPYLGVLALVEQGECPQRAEGSLIRIM